MNDSAKINAEFEWQPRPRAAAAVHALVEEFLGEHALARDFAQRLRTETGTRLGDWIDHLGVSTTAEQTLRDAQFVPVEEDFATEYNGRLWRHEGGMFPMIVTSSDDARSLVIAVESVEAFLDAQHLNPDCTVDGDPLATVRKCLVAREGDAEFWVVERHGGRGWQLPPLSSDFAVRLQRCRQAFDNRERDFADNNQAFRYTLDLVRQAIDQVGVDRACDLFFASERDYWQRRNHAAQVQKTRQDLLGLGWANHDHHTYRSSRASFVDLIALFEELGCHCRERFYAGAEAGWGAQVLEQPICGIVIFADVDLTPEELSDDFAHQSLPPLSELGTVGLWCRLHGEAIYQAGMHHLECQFDFDAARAQLKAAGIETMAPFTDFDFLKQAFTQGETWKVAERRVAGLLSDRMITAAQAEQFRRNGAIGSHLEILERNDGYKGFNQTGVSEIILKTDPRTIAGG